MQVQIWLCRLRALHTRDGRDITYRAGYAVDAFLDPERALDHLSRDPYDCALILIDVKMLGISGSELARHVKNIWLDIKVMILTAFELDKDLIRARPR